MFRQQKIKLNSDRANNSLLSDWTQNSLDKQKNVQNQGRGSGDTKESEWGYGGLIQDLKNKRNLENERVDQQDVNQKLPNKHNVLYLE